MPNEQLSEIMHSRARRRFARGLKRKPMALIQKLRKAKKEAPPLEKPAIVKTHLRDMIIVPEMVGSIVGIYNGKTFNQVSLAVHVNSLFELSLMMRRWRDWWDETASLVHDSWVLYFLELSSWNWELDEHYEQFRSSRVISGNLKHQLIIT